MLRTTIEIKKPICEHKRSNILEEEKRREGQMEKSREGCEIPRPHVALYPAVTAGLGHLIPFLEFARKLVTSHSFSVTLITPPLTPYPTHSKYVSLLIASNPHAITHLQFAQPDPLDEEDAEDVHKQFFAQISKFMPLMEQSLRTLQQPNHPFSPVCALICDLFNAESLDVGARLGLPTYVFFTCSAAFLCYMFSFPRLSLAETNGTHPVCLNIPGWKAAFHQQDFPNLPHALFRLGSPLRGMKAILVNTFHELEARTIHALMSGTVEQIDSAAVPPIHAVGPVTRSFDLSQVDGEREERLKMWLDSRAKASVVFASFGTYGFMSTEQLREIALGLEASGLSFVWVVRGIGEIGSSSLEVAELSSVLPEGFLRRVAGRGQVLSSWAPQVEILSHPAVGVFVSHCGWNSVLEAISFAVPLIAWPLYAEQRLNCFFVVNELMVGLEAVKGEDGLVGRIELQSVLERIMHGEEGRLVRRNMEELSLKAKCAVKEKEGSSFVSTEEAFNGLLRGTQSNHTR